MKTDRYEVFRRIGVERKGLLISNLNFNSNQLTLVIEFLYDPELLLPFSIKFTNVQSFKFQLTETDFSLSEPADVIATFIGLPSFEEEAFIYTDLFDIWFLYQQMEVIKNW